MRATTTALALCLALLTAGSVSARQIYSVTYDDWRGLVELEAEGILVRHVGHGEALVEGDQELDVA